MNDFGGENLLRSMATHYRQNWTIPHTKDELTLEFSAENLQEIEEQFWGLDNVIVEVLNAVEVPPLEPAQLAELPKLLGSNGSANAAAACWDLIARPEQALSLIKQMKTEMLRTDAAAQKRQTRIVELVRGLDAPVYADRVEALRASKNMVPRPRQSSRAKKNSPAQPKHASGCGNCSTVGPPRPIPYKVPRPSSACAARESSKSSTLKSRWNWPSNCAWIRTAQKHLQLFYSSA